MKIRNVLIAMAALAVAASTFALPPGEDPPPPPPPPTLNDCSPGFWKNHQDLWTGEGMYCGAGPLSCVEYTLGELKSKGPGSGDRRHNAASALNAWADFYYQALVCTD